MVFKPKHKSILEERKGYDRDDCGGVVTKEYIVEWGQVKSIQFCLIKICKHLIE